MNKIKHEDKKETHDLLGMFMYKEFSSCIMGLWFISRGEKRMSRIKHEDRKRIT